MAQFLKKPDDDGFLLLETAVAIVLILALCLATGRWLAGNGRRLVTCRHMAEFGEHRRAAVLFLRNCPDPPKTFWLRRERDGTLQACAAIEMERGALPRVEWEREDGILIRCTLFFGKKSYQFLATSPAGQNFAIP
jgi:hypothetical protein